MVASTLPALPSYDELHQPPTYEQAVTVCVPPPDYYTVAAVSPLSPLRDLYRTQPLDLVDLTRSTVTPSIDNLENVSFGSYSAMTEEEIENYYHSLCMVLEDKAKQIARNVDFVQKKVKTRSPNPYIDRLRESSCADFMRIRKRVLKEAQGLGNVFDMLMLHNSMFVQIQFSIDQLQKQTQQLGEKESLIISQQLLESVLYRGMVVKNLESIQSHINKLASDDDVSYVLKERAKIYNDAKEVVRRQAEC